MWQTFCFLGFVINAAIVVALMGTEQWQASLYHFCMAMLFVPGFVSFKKEKK